MRGQKGGVTMNPYFRLPSFGTLLIFLILSVSLCGCCANPVDARRSEMLMPDRFAYIRPLMQKYGDMDWIVFYDQSLDVYFSPEELQMLSSMEEKISRCGDALEMSKWINTVQKHVDNEMQVLSSMEERVSGRSDAHEMSNELSRWTDVARAYEDARRLRNILRMLAYLNSMGKLENAQGDVRYYPQLPLDWSKLPASLAFLREPAETYGYYGFECDIAALLRRLTPAEKQRMREVRDAAERHLDELGEWFEHHPSSSSAETKLLEHLADVLHLLDLTDPSSTKTLDTDEPHAELNQDGKNAGSKEPPK